MCRGCRSGLGAGCIDPVRRPLDPGRSELCTVSRSGRSLKIKGVLFSILVEHVGNSAPERNLPVVYNVEDIIILLTVDVGELEQIFP